MRRRAGVVGVFSVVFLGGVLCTPLPAEERGRRSDREAGPAQERRREQRRALLERLRDMDADKDGKVTRAEWKGREAAFDRLDRDGDGSVEIATLARRGEGGGRAERDRPAGDAGEEARRGRIQQLFNRLDRDGDGSLSMSEFAAFARRVLAERGDADRPAERPRQAANRFRRILGRVIARHDQDGDGKVTAEEYKGDAPFARLDRNKDGVLSKADQRPRRQTDERPSRRPPAEERKKDAEKP